MDDTGEIADGRETFTGGLYFFARGRYFFTRGLEISSFLRETLMKTSGATPDVPLGVGTGVGKIFAKRLIIN